jgi:hypothetical protein
VRAAGGVKAARYARLVFEVALTLTKSGAVSSDLKAATRRVI